VSRLHSRAGWSINAETDHLDITALGMPTRSFASRTTYTISDLRMTLPQARAIVFGGSQYRGAPGIRPARYADDVIVSHLEITEAEAVAISQGQDPLTVLGGGSGVRLVFEMTEGWNR
jgi:hypothetical protein